MQDKGKYKFCSIHIHVTKYGIHICHKGKVLTYPQWLCHW